MFAKSAWSLLVATALVAGTAVSAQDKAPVVVIETSLGNITVQLDPEKAPISVKNFLSYVDEGFYNGTIFHRVIKGFMIQGGGMTADMQRKPTKAPIRNEATNGLSNVRGTIAMARTGEVNSATSQFFINTIDNGARGLDHSGIDPAKFGYAVFGKVIDGMDVVDKIESVKTGPGDVPVEPVVIKAIKRK
jgi:cyclophilin family peptidyl-prolyl cis-trans isomerase